ncbi:MAG: DUF1501 domain-containing protein [Planctomycetota bacterium]|nr:DUF1501 domain-containing protein [Planctomycetota bacterium]MDA1213563.1 DUF1501 domain-containing protein [Planctomycetota bacterium]
MPIIHSSRTTNASRRAFLSASGLGLVGLTSGQFAKNARAANAAGSGGKAKSTILIYLNGGPSQIDIWDMKPHAPREYRGDFHPAQTSAPGVTLCEYLPKLAQQSHHIALVNSLGQHNRAANDHGAGRYYIMTGHVRDTSLPNQPTPSDWPYVGSVVTYKKPAHPSLPSSIWLPTKSGPDNVNNPGTFGARLGVQHDPFYVLASHEKPLEFRSPSLTLEGDISVSRLQDRRFLLKTLDDARRGFERSTSIGNYSQLQQQAFELLTSQAARVAFDVTRESDDVRRRYGETVNGMSMLMARRLVEAKVPFITLYWLHNYEEDKKRGCLGGAWDTHWKNFSCLKDYLLPLFDQPFSALLSDLHERGLLDETLVLVTAEMGRTPKIGDPRSGGDGAPEPGRDHWTHCQTALLAGGGIRGGQTYGSSDKIAAYPADRPVGPEHIAHTVFHAMGIHDLTAYDNQNRPYNLLDEGQPITELF